MKIIDTLQTTLINEVPDSLDEKIYNDVKILFDKKEKIEKNYKIKNTNQSRWY